MYLLIKGLFRNNLRPRFFFLGNLRNFHSSCSDGDYICKHLYKIYSQDYIRVQNFEYLFRKIKKVLFLN